MIKPKKQNKFSMEIIISIAALIIALATLIVTAAAFVYNIQVNIKNEAIAKENLLLSFRTSIDTNRMNFETLSTKTELPDIEELLASALEGYLTSYETACQAFLDGKLDDNAFKNKYFEEISNLVKDGYIRNEYLNAPSEYPAVLEVYNLWTKQNWKKSK